MKIACLSDVHANIHALELVLEQAELLGCDTIACCGDIVGFGAFPNEAIEFLQVASAYVVKGNVDHNVVSEARNPSSSETELMTLGERMKHQVISWTAQELDEDNITYLENLPISLSLADNGSGILIVHGSPGSIDEGLYEDTDEARFFELAESVSEKLILVGHTHISFEKEVKGVKFVNPGSVGRSIDGDTRACYVMLDVDESDDGLYVEVTARRVKYDVESAAKAIIRKGLPREYADNLRWGK